MRNVLRQIPGWTRTPAAAVNPAPVVSALVLFHLSSAPAALAQLPLSIEALLMPPSTFTLSTQTHWQQGRQPVLASRLSPSGAAFLSVGQREMEQGHTSIGARYGFAPRLELNARLSHRHTRWRAPGGPATRAEGAGVDIGLSWLALPERSAPAVLLDVRADLVSRRALPGADAQWLDGLEVGVTGYRSLDPVVLSLSARYRHQRESSVASGSLSAEHNVLLAPQVNFAVNAEVTLVGGLSLQYRALAQDAAGERQSGVATALRLGLGYAASRRSTLFLNSTIATSGAGRGAGLDLEWLYRFR